MAKLLDGVLELGGAVATFVARRRRSLEDGKPLNDWTPTAHERESVAQPLANILLRRADLSDLENTNDLVDGIAVITGVGHYALRALDGEPGGRQQTAPSAPPAANDGGNP